MLKTIQGGIKMSKFLYISGNSDYSALEIEESKELESIKNHMLQEGLTKMESEDGSLCEILEFKDVDGKFVDFVINNLCDYDSLKSSCIYKIED